jgi:oligogalacturonide lyase
VVSSTFRMGHVQANPFKPGEILYCWETGGDAPQRMWIVNADGSGNRPVFPEAESDWVTHEQFADADHVIFNLMGHTDKLSQRPTGILVVDLRTGVIENLGQLPFTSPGRSFWHNGVTYDGRYAAGDDFDGNLWRIDRESGERTLLSTGHWMKPDHLHPSFSADNRRILVQSGLLTDGKKLSLAVVPAGDQE